MPNDIIIESPSHIEAEYRSGINQGIDAIHGVAGAVIATKINDAGIQKSTTRIQRFIDRWLSNGTDASGVYDSRKAGSGYRIIRSAIYDTEQSHRERIVEAWARSRKQNISKSITRREFNDVLGATIRQNVSLIKDVTNQQSLLIERTLRDAWLQPELQIALKDDIGKIQRKGKNRAALIAENEIGNLHADLQMLRFNKLGIAEYIWRTSQDERVRDRHISLNGQKFFVGHPTTAEGGLPPGKPIRCRCVSIPVFAAAPNRIINVDFTQMKESIISSIANDDWYGEPCTACGGF